MAMKKYLRLILIILLSIALSLLIGQFVLKPSVYRSEVCFSPEGHTQDRIIKEIDSSNSTIDLAIYSFTAQEIKSAFERAKQRGVKIRIIVDSMQAKGAHSVVKALIDEGLNIKITHGKERGIMHNKFAIFDKKLLFTGSYNWTANAEHFNYENAVFISDTETIRQYQNEFDKIWNSVSVSILK
jgi:phosphatidylserine/phosphatidylglycerophosphate/cardiolipin synthase-like enzyme